MAWTEYEKLVLFKLEQHGDALADLKKNLEALRKEYHTLRSDHETFKVRAGLFGSIGGAASSIGLLLFKGFFKS